MKHTSFNTKFKFSQTDMSGTSPSSYVSFPHSPQSVTSSPFDPFRTSGKFSITLCSVSTPDSSSVHGLPRTFQMSLRRRYRTHRSSFRLVTTVRPLYGLGSLVRTGSSRHVPPFLLLLRGETHCPIYQSLVGWRLCLLFPKPPLRTTPPPLRSLKSQLV